MKLLEDETQPSVKDTKPILPDLMENIVTGNALISGDDIQNIDLSIEELLAIAPFDWNSINGGKKFDVILGNPPYVKTEDIHSLSGEIEFNIYKKKYKSAHKQFDKYFLFVEKAMELLKENGVTCYIIPNKFYKIAAGQELRKLLCEHVMAIDDFGDAQLFPDKTIYSAIVTVGKNNCEKMKYSYIKSVVDLWVGENIESIEINNSNLNQNPWSLTSDIEFMKMINHVQEHSVPLSDVAEIFNGIQTSAERPEKFSDKKEVYWFDNSCIESEDAEVILVNRYSKKYKIEKSILKPYFKPTKADIIICGLGFYELYINGKNITKPILKAVLSSDKIKEGINT